MTSSEINLLPETLRKYIHDLETNCDPAGIIRENTLLNLENKMLRCKIEQMVLDKELSELKEILDAKT